MTDRIAGDVDYESAGPGYASQRRTDPRIAALLHAALGPARTVLNVGAGAGSYEPVDREVTAVEPSAVMRAQRPAHLSVAIDAVAEDLPFADRSFDAAMATVTIHQWPDLARGLAELRRVSRGPVVILTCERAAMGRYWLRDYVPEVLAVERRRFPEIEDVVQLLGGTATVTTVPIPVDCVDGFAEAFYARPERFLDPAVRASQSAWTFVDPAVARAGLDRLAADLESGVWDQQHGQLRTQPEFLGCLRLITAQPA